MPFHLPNLVACHPFSTAQGYHPASPDVGPLLWETHSSTSSFDPPPAVDLRASSRQIDKPEENILTLTHGHRRSSHKIDRVTDLFPERLESWVEAAAMRVVLLLCGLTSLFWLAARADNDTQPISIFRSVRDHSTLSHLSTSRNAIDHHRHRDRTLSRPFW